VGAPDVRTFDGGIAYHGMEIVHTLLGRTTTRSPSTAPSRARSRSSKAAAATTT
jgi:hypothetical protein